jgi:hypothetical protein
MSALRDFAADLLELCGAAVVPIESEEADVLSPASVQEAMAWPEIARLSFGAERSEGAIPIGLEGDCLERFERLLGTRGMWAERALARAPMTLRDHERILDRALELPNAVWRLQSVTSATASCVLLAFRYSALSDEEREGVIWLGFNETTGSALGDVLPRLRASSTDAASMAPDASLRATRRSNPEHLISRVQVQLEQAIRRELDPFLHAMRRRLERDRARIYTYHDDLRHEACRRLLQGKASEKGRNATALKRDELRIAAIEREYRAKLDDLEHNYALRISVTWVQGIVLQVPVERFNVLVKRRKNERPIALDWHVPARAMELPPVDFGASTGIVRLACDEAVHLTEPAAQGACEGCGKPYCRACHRAGCPRCHAVSTL